MLVQQVQAQLVRPPVAVRRAASGGVTERALDLVGHRIISPGRTALESKARAAQGAPETLELAGRRAGCPRAPVVVAVNAASARATARVIELLAVDPLAALFDRSDGSAKAAHRRP